jgi:hypothetical protein
VKFKLNHLNLTLTMAHSISNKLDPYDYLSLFTFKLPAVEPAHFSPTATQLPQVKASRHRSINPPLAGLIGGVIGCHPHFLMLPFKNAYSATGQCSSQPSSCSCKTAGSASK